MLFFRACWGGGECGLGWGFNWMGFNCLMATESLREANLLFTTKFPEIPGTHLIDLRRMTG